MAQDRGKRPKKTREEGVEEGETKKARKIAKLLLQEEMSLEMVCKITDLSESIVLAMR